MHRWGGIALRALIRFWMCQAQCRSDGAGLLSDTHPWLAEAVGVSLVLQVLLLLGLLELVSQPLYPVVVAGGHLPIGAEGSSR